MRDDDIWLNSHLVGDIYAAVADPVMRFRSVMDALAREIGCDAAYFKVVRRPDGEVMAGIGGGMVDGSDRDYLENYLETDVRVPRVALAPRRTILDDRQLISAEEMRYSPFHHEWVPRYGLGHLMHVNIAHSLRHTAIVTCAQATPRGEFESRQRRVLSLYVPHFERAVQLQLRLLELEWQASLMTDAFDRLTTAAFILDGTGQVIRTNTAADKTFAEGDGIGLRHGRLVVSAREATAMLEERLREAIFALPDAARRDDTAHIILGRPSGLPPYQMELLPLPGSSSPGPARGVAFLVLLHDPLRETGGSVEYMRRRYGLTPAEARLAQAVTEGVTLREFAEGRQISVGTVRFQMKQILHKTGCRRQSELVRLISLGL